MSDDRAVTTIDWLVGVELVTVAPLFCAENPGFAPPGVKVFGEASVGPLAGTVMV